MSDPLAGRIGARLAALAPDGDWRALRRADWWGEVVAVYATGAEILPRSTPRQAAHELEDFAAAAAALETCARNVSYRGMTALGGGGKDSPRGLLAAIKVMTGRDLSEWAVDARAAAAELARHAAAPGRKRNAKEMAVARELARAYRDITRKRPTISVDPTRERTPRGGPFIALARDVFHIVGLPAGSADRACREAVDNLNAEIRSSSVDL